MSPPLPVRPLKHRGGRPLGRRPPPRREQKPARELLWRRFFEVFTGIVGVVWRVFWIRARHSGADEAMRIAWEWKALFERLGGVFVKLGQFVAVRTDQMPWEVCQVFAKLLDRAPPFPSAHVVALIESELQMPLTEVFSEFDPVPTAAASIGQVHFGRLRESGEAVAIKVQRPGIAAAVEVDVDLILFFARVIDALNLTMGVRQVPLAREIQRIMAEELSYLNEARATDEFRKSLRGRKHVYAPRVHFEYTTDRVLVMERIHGVALSSLIQAIEGDNQVALDVFEGHLGIDRVKLAKRLYAAILEQLFEHNISHGDPHPGNIIVMPDNQLCFIDFGAVSYYGPLFRMKMMRMMHALGDENVDDAIDGILDSWEPLPPRNVDEFKSLLKPLLLRMINNGKSRHGDPNLKSNGRVMSEATSIGARLGLLAPWELLRYNRQMWQLDTTVTTLNPEFRYKKAIRSYFKGRSRRTVRKSMRRRDNQGRAAAFAELLNQLPGDLADVRYTILSNLRRGEHMYRHSIGKAAYLGKLLFDHLLAAAGLAAAAIVVARAALGGAPVNGWLGAHLWPPMPWWAWALALVYATTVLQRIRLRFSEIEVTRK